MKTICYLRQSSGETNANDSISIAVQEAECRKLAMEKGYEIIKTISEPNCSGRTFPEGFEAIAAVDSVFQKYAKETGRSYFRKGLGEIFRRLDDISAICVYDVTRLFRPLNGSFLGNLIIQKLIEHDVKVLSVKEGLLDFSTFQTQLITGLTSSINSEHLQQCREKAKASLKKLKDSGEWDGSCIAFGYRGTGRSHEVEIVPHRAEVVKLVYKMFLEGKKMGEIMRACQPLMENDEKAYRLHRCQLDNILRKPIYCGYCYSSSGELVKAKPIEGKEIIDFETWQKVQKMLSRSKKCPKREKKHWLPLSGRIICGYCGSRMVHHPVRDIIDTRCPRNASLGAEKSCKNGVDWLRLNDALYPLLAIHYAEKLKISQASSETKSKLQEQETALDNLKCKEEKLNKMFMDDIISQDAFEKMTKDLRTKEKTIESQILSLKQSLKLEYSSTRFFMDIRKVNNQWLQQSEADEAYKSLIKKVKVWHEKIEVVLDYMGEHSFELPIQLGKFKKKIFPKADFCFNEEEGSWSEDIIYCYEELNPIEIEERRKLLLDAGDIRIWIVR